MNPIFIELTEARGGGRVIVNMMQALFLRPENEGGREYTHIRFNWRDGYIDVIETPSEIGWKITEAMYPEVRIEGMTRTVGATEGTKE
jgi:hypothetical protein